MHITSSEISYQSSTQAPYHHQHLSHLSKLVLIRGLPGSGKSTMAKVLAQLDYEHFEADMFFERNGSYVFDGSRIKEAHAWCRQSTKQALDKGKRVVVSNTFTRLVEMEPYLSMANKVRVIEATGRWQNTHDVPQETLQSMATRWEALPTGNRLRA